jgi:hypothetical protein
MLFDEDNQPVSDLTKTQNGKVMQSKHFLMLITLRREQLLE